MEQLQHGSNGSVDGVSLRVGGNLGGSAGGPLYALLAFSVPLRPLPEIRAGLFVLPDFTEVGTCGLYALLAFSVQLRPLPEIRVGLFVLPDFSEVGTCGLWPGRRLQLPRLYLSITSCTCREVVSSIVWHESTKWPVRQVMLATGRYVAQQNSPTTLAAGRRQRVQVTL